MLAQAEILFPTVDWWQLSPLIALVGGALVLLLAGALTPSWPRGGYAWTAAGIALVSGLLAVWRWSEMSSPDSVEDGSQSILNGALAYDKFGLFVTFVVCAATFLVVLVTDDELERSGRQGPEVYALMLIAGAGAVVMGAANDLIVLFLGLETLSLALYVLAASDRERSTSQEAGIKYFVLGGFASAFFLYGVALMYGATQSTNIGEIITYFSGSIGDDVDSPLALAAIALMIVGLAFKVAAVPFHVWTPDVYEGAPTHVTGFMASVGKVGAFAALLRVLVIALPFQRDDWRPVIWVLAVLSLVVGAVLAVVQTDVKRLLAYSSINHAGFMLVGVVAAGYHAGEVGNLGDGMPSVMAYLMFYSVLTVGSFGVVALVGRQHGGDTSLDAFAGLAKRRPAIALGLSVFLLAQAGVPLTTGFIAKFGAIQAAVTEGSYLLAIIAMVSSVVAAYLYLKIMVKVWLEPGGESDEREAVPFTAGFSIAAAAVFTIAVGIYPSVILDLADSVTQYAR